MATATQLRSCAVPHQLSLERMGDNFDPEDFMNSIRCNHTVRQVCFSGTFVRELQQQNLWSVILESIGYLRSLEELQIWCSSLPVAVFAHTLRHALRLRKVYLFRVTLQGSQADMDELAGGTLSQSLLADIAGRKSAACLSLSHTHTQQQQPSHPHIHNLYLQQFGIIRLWWMFVLEDFNSVVPVSGCPALWKLLRIAVHSRLSACS